MLLLLFLLRNSNYLKYVLTMFIVIILIRKFFGSYTEQFTGFNSNKEKYAYCDTIEEVGKFCKKNKSKLCSDYTNSLKKTKNYLNMVLLQAEGNSFDGPAMSNKKPKL